MLNQVVLVGRMVEDPKVEKLNDGKNVTNLKLAVQRNYKNTDGIYETDFIDVTLWNEVAINTSKYCQKGDLVGIKGHLKNSSYEDKDGNKKYVTDVIAEKVTFLTSNRDNKNKENQER